MIELKMMTNDDKSLALCIMDTLIFNEFACIFKSIWNDSDIISNSKVAPFCEGSFLPKIERNIQEHVNTQQISTKLSDSYNATYRHMAVETACSIIAQQLIDSAPRPDVS